MRKTRMQLWLLLSTLALSRALTLAGKVDDLDTVRRIRDSLLPWID
jgi:hypothetical protein